jgi:hypothetical protein
MAPQERLSLPPGAPPFFAIDSSYLVSSVFCLLSPVFWLPASGFCPAPPVLVAQARAARPGKSACNSSCEIIVVSCEDCGVSEADGAQIWIEHDIATLARLPKGAVLRRVAQ